MNLKGIGMRYFVAAPDIISFLNLVFGFLAIIMVFEQNLYLAGCCVIIAVIFDSIDGWVARKTGRDDVFGFGMNTTLSLIWVIISIWRTISII